MVFEAFHGVENKSNKRKRATIKVALCIVSACLSVALSVVTLTTSWLEIPTAYLPRPQSL